MFQPADKLHQQARSSFALKAMVIYELLALDYGNANPPPRARPSG
jgi:hypothetical protein